jgi:hypothetical protein
MPPYDRRDRDEDRQARRMEPRDERRDDPRDREDFGQADYSRDYGYDADHRSGYRAAERAGDRADDYGQADYSRDWAYDPDRGPYRRAEEDARGRDDRHREPREDPRDGREPRSWMDRAGDYLAGRDADQDGRARRRRGPSDRVLWAVIVERLEDERGLDLRDVEVLVDAAEVTLNGTVRRKEDKRRIEDVADIDGVRHVQNNLRVRDRGHWTFL